MDYIWLLWFLLAIVFAVIELTNASFFIIWFGVGSLAAMFISFITNNLTYQAIVFVIISTTLLLTTRKVTSKLTKGSVTPTNVDAVIGKVGVIMQSIPAMGETGIAKVDGETWSAVSSDNNPIEIGTKVKVLEVTGVKLVVQKLYCEKEQKQ